MSIEWYEMMEKSIGSGRVWRGRRGLYGDVQFVEGVGAWRWWET